MYKIINKIRIKSLLLIFILIVLSLIIPHKTFAASLSLLPNSSGVSVGNIISLNVYVNTENKFINNAETSIQFPVDMIEVLSVTKSSSIFSLWVEEPSFSNSTGQITFNGGLPTPGFSGPSGYIVTVTFKAKKEGTASIIFTDGAVRENDGMGTDILSAKNGAIIQITTPIPVIAPTPSEKITVSTFVPSIRFEGIQGIVKLSDEKTIPNMDYYTIQIDEVSSFKVKKGQLVNYEYNLPILNGGSHTTTIVSFDKKGKYTEYILTFISPAITVPTLTLSSNVIVVGENVNVFGKTDYPNKNVNVILEQDGKEINRYAQTTGANGSFNVTTDKMNNSGIVSIYAETLLSNTVKSGPSEKVYLKVSMTKVVRITLSILYLLLLLLIILIILLILLFLLYLGWHKFFGLKSKIKNETKQTATDIHKEMILLKNELTEQLNSLEKVKSDRSLNEKEEAIFNEIKKNVDGVETFIEKRLKKLM